MLQNVNVTWIVKLLFCIIHVFLLVYKNKLTFLHLSQPLTHLRCLRVASEKKKKKTYIILRKKKKKDILLTHIISKSREDVLF